MVLMRAPSRTASARSAELRMERVPTYEKREIRRAIWSGRRVDLVFMIAPTVDAGAVSWTPFSVATDMARKYARSRLSGYRRPFLLTLKREMVMVFVVEESEVGTRSVSRDYQGKMPGVSDWLTWGILEVMMNTPKFHDPR